MAHQDARRQIVRIKRQIAQVELLGRGTLVERTKVCGKPNCRCATDPSARHGPYYEWNRYVGGVLEHATVPPACVTDVRRALDNHQRVLKLLARWERQSLLLILGPQALRHRKRKG